MDLRCNIVVREILSRDMRNYSRAWKLHLFFSLYHFSPKLKAFLRLSVQFFISLDITVIFFNNVNPMIILFRLKFLNFCSELLIKTFCADLLRNI